MSENADRDHHTFAIGDGGDFTLLVDAAAACRWTITAK
jgi:hypothetical protein